MKSRALKFKCNRIIEYNEVIQCREWYIVDKEVKHKFELIEMNLSRTCVLLEVKVVLTKKLRLLDSVAI